jgi:hypothetical protein
VIAPKPPDTVLEGPHGSFGRGWDGVDRERPRSADYVHDHDCDDDDGDELRGRSAPHCTAPRGDSEWSGVRIHRWRSNRSGLI